MNAVASLGRLTLKNILSSQVGLVSLVTKWWAEVCQSEDPPHLVSKL